MNFGCREIFGSTLGGNGEEETVNKIKILRKEWITEFPLHSKAKVHGLRVLWKKNFQQLTAENYNQIGQIYLLLFNEHGLANITLNLFFLPPF